eukprot:10729631-Ditylum_brightwellii.AAC.1
MQQQQAMQQKVQVQWHHIVQQHAAAEDQKHPAVNDTHPLQAANENNGISPLVQEDATEIMQNLDNEIRK